MSAFFDRQKDGYQKRGWILTDIQVPTTVRGRCLAFGYSIQGLNVEALRLIRVDIMTVMPDQVAEISQEKHKTSWEFINTSDDIAAAVTTVMDEAFGDGSAKLEATVIWSQEDGTGGKWKAGQSSYSSSKQHLFIFEATPVKSGQESYRGYVAIDNIKITEGACGADCNFDAVFTTCNWENEPTTDDFDWSVARGSLKSFTGPTRDQSTSAIPGRAGGYAYIDSAYPRRPGDKARLRLAETITTEPDSPQCLVFYVNMYGSGIGSLSVIQDVGNGTNMVTLWEMIRPASSPRDLWHKAQVTIASEQPASIIFEATIGETDRGDIAIDTVSLEAGPCVIMPHVAARYRSVGCSFNSDLCGYLSQNVPLDQSAQSPALWSRVRGGGGRYPSGHRALAAGEEDWYALFDVRNYQHRPLDRGYLLGPQIPLANDPLCLGFWFYMSTDVASVPYLGTLRVLLIPRNATGDQITGASAPKVLWALTNQQEAAWTYAQVSFIPNVPYLLAFEGLRANNVLGIIGVDDVTIFPSKCSLQPSQAMVDPRDCSFEFNFCNWKSINPGSALASDLRPQDWKLADRNHNFGSFRDHTFNLDNSGYVYFDTINIQTKTWLISPTITTNQSFCFQFWFAAAASQTSNLEVKRQYNNGTMGELWRIEFADLELPTGSAVSNWLPAQVMLPGLESQSAIVLEGNSNNGGFALDDVRLTPLADGDSCPTRPANGQAAVGFKGFDIFSFVGDQRSSRNSNDNSNALNRFRSEQRTLPEEKSNADEIVFQ
eukprot:TRINITY_DN10140_c0_g1_i3.p1 TRINITY_DN10140_c0_g1~~TRINITY_DN10140_c0_g1_i3.p1  ORF type:complete len:904 (-),score=218.90 TRINITY_DN10140_c0_g1_i3:76-2388(-)